MTHPLPQVSEAAVSIVLASLNGADFLQTQLTSLHCQSHQNWHLILSDDGSGDDTLEIAQRHAIADRMTLLQGPRRGVAANFLSALRHVPPSHYAGFCDQDDHWAADKLARALRMTPDCATPMIYSAGRLITDARLHPVKTQRRRKPRFADQLIRNACAGHSCLLNPAAVAALQTHACTAVVPFHDWWCALFILGIGGRSLHDPHPVLSYRQHGQNVVGATGGRLRSLTSGQYSGWVTQNLQALHDRRALLTPEAREMLDQMRTGLDRPHLFRILALSRPIAQSPLERLLFALI